jgi:hypothetical protein
MDEKTIDELFHRIRECGQRHTAAEAAVAAATAAAATATAATATATAATAAAAKPDLLRKYYSFHRNGSQWMSHCESALFDSYTDYKQGKASADWFQHELRWYRELLDRYCRHF